MKRWTAELQIGTEALQFIASPADFLLGPLLDQGLRSTRHPPRDLQLLLVNSWVHKSPQHWMWRWYLEQCGVRTGILYFPMQELSFAQSAEALRHYIERHDLHDLSIAAISSGALTTLLYLEDHAGWERVRRFIAIGAPFGGANAAVLLYWHRHLRELLPVSTLIGRIQHTPVQHPERLICLSAAYDELVPRASSCLPGTRCEVMPVIGHDNLHSASKATYDRVAALTLAPWETRSHR